MITALPLFFSSSISSQLASSAGRALAGQDTVGERLGNWRSTLDLWWSDGPVAIAVGRTRGSDNRRMVTGSDGRSREIAYSAHNHYVNTISNTGILGLGLYLLILLKTMKELLDFSRKSTDKDSAMTSGVLIVLMGSQLAYYMAYGVDFIQYTIFGVAIAWSLQVKQSKTIAKNDISSPDAKPIRESSSLRSPHMLQS